MHVYRNAHNWGNRVGADGFNSNSRPKTFDEMCANKFNDDSFKRCSKAYPEFHDDFSDSIPLFEAKDQKLPLVIPIKITNQLESFRCRLSFERTCSMCQFYIHVTIFFHPTQALVVACKWENSGNGSGQRIDGDE